MNARNLCIFSSDRVFGNHSLFAGISLEGSTIRPDNDANKSIYGEKISAQDIVIAHETHVPPAAEGLISTLNAKTPKHKSP